MDISRRMKDRHMLAMTDTAVQPILRNGAAMLERLCREIHDEMAESDIMGIGETAFPIDGKAGRMRTARNKAAAHYSLESGRSGKVLKKIWKKFDGILASGGFAPYRTVFWQRAAAVCRAPAEERKASGKKIGAPVGPDPVRRAV